MNLGLFALHLVQSRGTVRTTCVERPEVLCLGFEPAAETYALALQNLRDNGIAAVDHGASLDGVCPGLLPRHHSANHNDSGVGVSASTGNVHVHCFQLALGNEDGHTNLCYFPHMMSNSALWPHRAAKDKLRSAGVYDPRLKEFFFADERVERVRCVRLEDVLRRLYGRSGSDYSICSVANEVAPTGAVVAAEPVSRAVKTEAEVDAVEVGDGGDSVVAAPTALRVQTCVGETVAVVDATAVVEVTLGGGGGSGVDFSDNEPPIGLLKVDVEGAEVDVIAGLGDDVWPRLRRLAVEVHSQESLSLLKELLADRFRGEVRVTPQEDLPDHWMVHATATRPERRGSSKRPRLTSGE